MEYREVDPVGSNPVGPGQYPVRLNLVGSNPVGSNPLGPVPVGSIPVRSYRIGRNSIGPDPGRSSPGQFLRIRSRLTAYSQMCGESYSLAFYFLLKFLSSGCFVPFHVIGISLRR